MNEAPWQLLYYGLVSLMVVTSTAFDIEDCPGTNLRKHSNLLLGAD